MNVFIEKLQFPFDEGWERFISPLQLSCIQHSPAGERLQEGNILIWGVQVPQKSAEIGDIKCGVLMAKVVKSTRRSDAQLLLLSISSITFASAKLSKLLGAMLLNHVIKFASDYGCSGVHIGCPQYGQYGDFVRRLTAEVGVWTSRPGKVVVRLSDIQRVGPLLERLERAVQRKKAAAPWQIESYDRNALDHWQDRIAFSIKNNLGIPWDPDDQSYGWEPSVQYSRVLKFEKTIIGWLICHFISEDVLRYGKLWVDPGWEQSGAPLAMLCDVMRSAHFQPNPNLELKNRTGYPIPRGCFISHPTNDNLHRLVTSKFKPVCDTWTELENYYYYFE